MVVNCSLEKYEDTLEHGTLAKIYALKILNENRKEEVFALYS